MRAIAVLSVLAYHAFPAALPGGFVGVDVFFVISGFLISGIILTAIRTGTFTFSQFYARRVRRIFPALALVLAASLCLGWLILFPADFRRLAIHVVAGAGFVSNLALWQEAGYFDTASELKPLLHLWSLGVEEQYYAIWPLLLVLAARFLHRLLPLILIVAVLSFAANIFLVGAHPSAAFYSPVTRFWELMIGSLLAYLQVFGAPGGDRGVVARFRAAFPANGLALVGAGALAASLVLTREDYAFPGWWALLPTAGTALLIGAGPASRINQSVLSGRTLVYIGLISYPLYLWHWPLLTFARIFYGDLPPTAIRVMMLALSFALAAATFRLLERPIRKRANWGGGRWVVASLSGAMIVMAIGASLVISGKISSASGSVAHVAEVSEALSDWDGGRNKTLPGDSERAVFFFGDSHMQQYWPRIEKVVREHRAPLHTIVFFAEGGCAPVPGIERRGYQCDRFVSTGFARAQQPDIDTVVIAASWPGFADRKDLFQAGPSARPIANILAPEEEWILRGFASALEDLRAHGKKIVLVLSSPRSHSFDPDTMLRRKGLLGWEVRLPQPIPRDAFEKLRAPVDDRLREIARRVGATTIDPADWLCSVQYCPALDARGRPLFKDLSHIRASVVREGFTGFDRFLYLPSGAE